MENVVITFRMFEEINRRVSDLRWIYNIDYFPDGIVDTSKVLDFIKSGKKKIVVLDRNIFDRLLKIATTGRTNQGRIQDVALLMIWCMINGCEVLPYSAISEHASVKCDEQIGQNEYKIFDEIFQRITMEVWFKLAEEKIKYNPIIIQDKLGVVSPKVKFVKNSIDYLFNYMAMIHLAYVLRTEKNNISQYFSFFKWYYDYSLVSRYTTVYVSLFLAGYDGFVGPKNIMSKDIDKVLAGCSNQAKDLCYLTEYSKDRVPTDCEFVFATDDYMLFQIQKLGNGSTTPIRLFENIITKNKRKVSKWVTALESSHKTISVRKDQYESYCEKQIKKEINQLKTTFD